MGEILGWIGGIVAIIAIVAVLGIGFVYLLFLGEGMKH